ncbi:eukaryotic translation initiation factor 1A, X-chromosomal [Lates japonicus]|uniref:Eukaryotic translation initiation factor 4C n=1 Tax=Lates japonicus TaxID=270547 RepID=A0AAD3MJ98_LATJO|nr:eukaryotic translation initiation factor 1A, X-chromosomal [Lates japonicus]
MPKNKGKGGKNRRRGKNENESEKRELVFKEDGQEYAQVIKMLGNGRLEAMCFDGTKRLCHIRGKLRKKVWINTSDIILVGLRDYQEEKECGDVEGENESEKSWCSKRMDRVILDLILEYAQVIKMLGNGRLEAMCFDGTKRLCHIRGKLRKKLASSSASADEARSLKASRAAEHAKINETDTFGPGDDDEIQFDDIGDDDEDIDDI